MQEVRARLDQAGHRHVRIIVSGGLTPERIRFFKEDGAPVDSYAVGSYIAGAQPIDFTGDLKEIDGKPIAKRGRIPGITPSPRLRRSTWQRGASRRPASVTGQARHAVAALGDGPGGPATRRLDELAERETAYGLFQRAGCCCAAATTRRRPCCSNGPSGSSRARARSSRRWHAPTTTAGSTAAAEATFRELLDIDPSAPYGHFGLGQALKQLGRHDEARTHLRVAVALAPHSPLYRNALKRLPPG